MSKIKVPQEVEAADEVFKYAVTDALQNPFDTYATHLRPQESDWLLQEFEGGKVRGGKIKRRGRKLARATGMSTQALGTVLQKAAGRKVGIRRPIHSRQSQAKVRIRDACR